MAKKNNPRFTQEARNELWAIRKGPVRADIGTDQGKTRRSPPDLKARLQADERTRLAEGRTAAAV